MTYLSQRDPRWAGTKIGSALFTAGQKGCAFTSLIMLWQAMFKKEITAAQYIALVSDKSLFTDKNHAGGAGLILWDKVCAKLNEMFGTTISFTGSEWGNKRANQIAALKAPKRGCLLQVNNGSHFVVLWRVPANDPNDPKELTVADPWYGKLVPVMKTYHNVTSARYFKEE